MNRTKWGPSHILFAYTGQIRKTNFRTQEVNYEMKSILSIAAGLVLAFSSAAFAQDETVIAPASALTTTAVAQMSAAPGTGVTGDAVPAVIPAMILLAPLQTGLPCISCAPSPTPLGFSLGVSVPTGYIATGATSLQLTSTFESITGGSCTLTLAIMQGTHTLFTTGGAITLAANTIYISSAAVTRGVHWHGTAAAVLTVTCGTASVLRTPLYFQ